MNKTKLYIAILVIVGFLFRLLAARNLGISADDSVHALRGINFIGSGKLESWDQSSGLHYVYQDIIYHIFGANLISSRLVIAFFGALSIILIYLFVFQIFKSKKAGLIAAVLLTFSPFLIKNTISEMDTIVMFFLIFSALFLFKFIENKKSRNLILCSILIGVAIMIKVYALFFTFSYFLLILFYSKDKRIKNLLLFSAIAFIFCIPTLAYNYLLYRDKGIVDLLFTNTLKIGIEKSKSLYNWNAGYMPYVEYKGFFFGNQKNWGFPPNGLSKLPGFIVMFILLTIEEPLIMIFGLLGFFLMFKKEYRKYLIFFLFIFPIPYIFMGAGIPMLKHFVFVPMLLLPMASIFIEKMSTKIKLKHLFIAFIIFNILWLGKGIGNIRAHIYSQSAESQLIEYQQIIPSNALVVVDSRIYRGYLGWIFHDKAYLESSQLIQYIEEANSQGPERAQYEAYIVECVTDDCGWGTISNQPEFNQSTEELFDSIKKYSQLQKEINEINKNKYYFPFIPVERTSRYKVYKSSVTVNPILFEKLKYLHVVMLYPVGYDRSIQEIFDDYTIHSSYDAVLDKSAHYILYGAVLLMLCSIVLLIILFIKGGGETELLNQV